MSSSCQIWITNNAGADRIQLPVLPETLTYTHNGNNESVNIAGLGETTIMQDRGAVTYDFSSIFPGAWFQGCQYEDLQEPSYYRDKLVEWKDSKQPVKLIITSSSVNTFCTIEKFTYKEKGGDPGTLHYDISLKEYRPLVARQIDTAATTPPEGSDSEAIDTTTQFGVVRTDGKRIKLFKKMSTSSKVLKYIPNRVAIKLFEKSGGWYKAKYKGATGYVKAEKIVLVTTLTPDQMAQFRATQEE